MEFIELKGLQTADVVEKLRMLSRDAETLTSQGVRTGATAGVSTATSLLPLLQLHMSLISRGIHVFVVIVAQRSQLNDVADWVAKVDRIDEALRHLLRALGSLIQPIETETEIVASYLAPPHGKSLEQAIV